MDRLAATYERVTDPAATRMFQRVLAGWAADVLGGPGGVGWPEADPVADHRNRDWRTLYSGSILDD